MIDSPAELILKYHQENTRGKAREQVVLGIRQTGNLVSKR